MHAHGVIAAASVHTSFWESGVDSHCRKRLSSLSFEQGNLACAPSAKKDCRPGGEPAMSRCYSLFGREFEKSRCMAGPLKPERRRKSKPAVAGICPSSSPLLPVAELNPAGDCTSSEPEGCAGSGDEAPLLPGAVFTCRPSGSPSRILRSLLK